MASSARLQKGRLALESALNFYKTHIPKRTHIMNPMVPGLHGGKSLLLSTVKHSSEAFANDFNRKDER